MEAVMPRVTPKLNFASAGKPTLRISDDDWGRIEAAYGFPLRDRRGESLREKICEITQAFVSCAAFEQGALVSAQVKNRVRAIKQAAENLRSAILKKRTEEDRYAKLLICHRAPLPFQDGRNALDNLAFQLLRVLKGCDLATAELHGIQKDNFRKGEAWAGWVNELTKIMKGEGLPTRARKDGTQKNQLGQSPFVTFISELQKFCPKKLQRSTHSAGALTKAITKARSERKTLPRWTEPNDDRIPLSNSEFSSWFE